MTAARWSMPPALAEPRLSLPASGLYASIINVRPAARSGGRRPAWACTRRFQRDVRGRASGATTTWTGKGGAFLAATYGVELGRAATARRRWCCSVLEDRAEFDREIERFPAHAVGVAGRRGAAAAAGADPAAAMGPGAAGRAWPGDPAHRERRADRGSRGATPPRSRALTGNLNTLIEQERVPADPLQGGAELPRPQPEDAAGRAAHRARRAGAAARDGRPAGGPHGRHRAAPAGPRRRQRRRALRAAPGAGAGAASHPRFAGQGVCRQGPGVSRSNARPT